MVIHTLMATGTRMDSGMTDSLEHLGASTAMLRLWQLISPALPIGAYAYSQGQEYAVESGWVKDQKSAEDWIKGQLQNNIACLDISVLKRMHAAWQQQNMELAYYWSDWLLAAREGVELQREDKQLGLSLIQVLKSQHVKVASELDDEKPVSFAMAFALAGVDWNIPLVSLAQGYAWAWCENQIAAAIKLVPLGQTAGQQILASVLESIPDIVNQALQIDDEDIGVMVPAVAIASAKHETQYTRLFRS